MRIDNPLLANIRTYIEFDGSNYIGMSFGTNTARNNFQGFIYDQEYPLRDDAIPDKRTIEDDFKTVISTTPPIIIQGSATLSGTSNIWNIIGAKSHFYGSVPTGLARFKLSFGLSSTPPGASSIVVRFYLPTGYQWTNGTYLVAALQPTAYQGTTGSTTIHTKLNGSFKISVSGEGPTSIAISIPFNGSSIPSTSSWIVDGAIGVRSTIRNTELL
jgi:hypothetical protein